MIVTVNSWTKVPTQNGFDLCTMESSVEVPREFWRYLFAGLAQAAVLQNQALLSSHEQVAGHSRGDLASSIATGAILQADALIAELEKEVPSA